ncbi:hypothetical protein CBM2586_A11477 [Cupriavidus phytorum]|uniref:Uncharacterized protein n=1 Tax=Cupriavidus taiwanensis TaxID=164546 RepID=A0A375BEB3_9BURK|nr:hypothetical protein CBM2586_A11477 [Cupriavidus taiwanensis]
MGALGRDEPWAELMHGFRRLYWVAIGVRTAKLSAGQRTPKAACVASVTCRKLDAPQSWGQNRRKLSDSLTYRTP